MRWAGSYMLYNMQGYNNAESRSFAGWLIINIMAELISLLQ